MQTLIDDVLNHVEWLKKKGIKDHVIQVRAHESHLDEMLRLAAKSILKRYPQYIYSGDIEAITVQQALNWISAFNDHEQVTLDIVQRPLPPPSGISYQVLGHKTDITYFIDMTPD